MTSLIGQSLGRYHILEQLGEGGMATVYKAYDTRLERDVVVKIIRRGVFPPEQIERILKRFEREAKALARLTHPNIVPIIDYGEYKRTPYLVMPYLPGGTLKQKLGKPMPWQEAVRILLPIALALDYAHEQNIIHRDIKPSNILLTGRDQPMLSDFGIAKILDMEDGQTLTATGVGVGTPEYMSPEQGMGKPVGPGTDIYSLGIVLYELLTRRKPYTADTPWAVVDKHVHDPLPSPRQFIPDLPEQVGKILLKALAKQPEDRYSDMAAFATALEKMMAGLPLPVPISLFEEPNLEKRQEKEEDPASGEISTSPSRVGDAAAINARPATLDELPLLPQVLPVETQEHPSKTDLEPERRKGISSDKGLKWKRWISITFLVALLGIGVAVGSGLLKIGPQSQGPLGAIGTDTRTPNPTFPPIHTIMASKTSTTISTLTPTFTTTPVPILSSNMDGIIPLYTLEGGPSELSSIAFSPNGLLLASGSSDGLVKLWDLSKGEEVRTFRRVQGGILSVAFSPDGKLLASGGADGTIRVRDATNGQEVRTLNGNYGNVNSIAFSSDGSFLASAVNGNCQLHNGNNGWPFYICGAVNIWNIANGQGVRTLNSGSKGIAFSPNGSLLACLCDGVTTLWHWDLPGGEGMRYLYENNEENSITFSPDGKLLATGGYAGIELWDVESRQKVRSISGHNILSLAFSPNGNILASGGGNGIELWDVNSGQELKLLSEQSVLNVVFSSDGLLLASGSYNGAITLWGVPRWNDTPQSLLTSTP